jgi:mannose-1-phosphate guanylyltransferase
LYVCVMAGGAGRRFWPKSRKASPKQFLSLSGKGTLIKQTVDRLKGFVPPDRIIIITGMDHVPKTRTLLPEIPARNVVGEPVGKDTAACIALGAAIISKEDPDAVMVVMPADHFIRPNQKLHQTLSTVSEAAVQSDSLFVFGIKPAFPATGYGYIKRGDKTGQVRGSVIFGVERFHEKPSLANAKKFVESGQYYWNSGIFVWKVSVILDALKKHVPKLSEAVEKIRPQLGTEGQEEAIAKAYQKLEKISIDYAVLEKTEDVKMVEADYEWDDLGSWEAVQRLFAKNRDGNIIIGKHCGVDTHECIIFAENHLVGTIGVSDLVIVQTRDATLICPKERAQEVKDLIDKMEKEGLEEYL